MEAKVMGLIEKCLDKKVLEMQLKVPKVPQSQGLSARSGRSDRSGRSACSARTSTETVVSQLDQPGVPSHVETDTSVKAEPQPEAVTMAGKRAQAQKLSDASLGKFDDDQSRLAHLEMQKSAAEARNKNRSSLCFGYEPPSRTDEAAKVETMAGKRAQAQKLSDASLGKFDADQSRLAYLEMQKSAEEVRNKNRSANAFQKAEAPKYPALLREVEGLAEKKGATETSMAGKRAKAQKVSEAKLGKFDADKSLDAYLDMQKSAEELRNKHRVGQGVF
ncbi:Scn11a [Symbiodinium pilosum]|uniref:Scn11a protein n=1 Tax=Symbiodinium pilosum TaxID=2952 RepID=A0A812RX17_SYMPI|nr:Scn11a [Symbiodinium pilosum]